MLSVSEFFTSLSTRAFRGKKQDGRTIASRLGNLSPAGRALLGNGVFMDEFLYPLGTGGRYQAHEVPPILCTTLPHLTTEPDALWDELESALAKRGQEPFEQHYRFIFEWLANRFNKDIWIERSGGSLNWVPTLARLFPDARFVHIYRDGRDTALSMQKHPYFRLRTQAAELLRTFRIDPFAPFNTPGISPWLPAFEHLRFFFFSKAQYERINLPLAAFGRFWSGMICHGVKDLEAMPSDKWLSVKYETLTEAPRKELERLVDFIGADFADDSWLKEASALPRSRPPSWHRLFREEHDLLAEACREGQELLGYDTTYSK